MDAYQTHQEVLLEACRQTTGPIVELGTGHYSTRLLDQSFPDRVIVSVEYEWVWIVEFEKVASWKHFFVCVKDFTHYEFPVRHAGVLFVDGDPAAQRRLCVLKYANDADLIVVHDTEPSCWPGYAWADCFDGFKYRFDDKRYDRWTTVVSNFQEFKFPTT